MSLQVHLETFKSTLGTSFLYVAQITALAKGCGLWLLIECLAFIYIEVQQLILNKSLNLNLLEIAG